MMPATLESEKESPVDTMPQRARTPQSRRRSLLPIGVLSPRNIGAVYVLVVICVIFSVWAPDTFPTSATVKQVINGNSLTAMAALALVIPLSTRTFDLSFAYVMTLSGVTAAHFVVVNHWAVPLAMLAGLLAALCIGVINGFVVVVLKIDSFIGTLATGSLVLAFITYFTHDRPVADARLAGGFSALSQSSIGGVIYPVFYALALAALLWYLLEHTPTGRRLYSVGFNADAARLANIRVDRLRFISLIASSFIAGFAGLCLGSLLSSGSPTAGTSYLLPAYAAVFVGATQFKNGRFNPWGSLVAVVMLGTGVVGLGLAAAPSWAADVFTGVVLLAALSAAGMRRRGLSAGKAKAEA